MPNLLDRLGDVGNDLARTLPGSAEVYKVTHPSASWKESVQKAGWLNPLEAGNQVINDLGGNVGDIRSSSTGRAVDNVATWLNPLAASRFLNRTESHGIEDAVTELGSGAKDTLLGEGVSWKRLIHARNVYDVLDWVPVVGRLGRWGVFSNFENPSWSWKYVLGAADWIPIVGSLGRAGESIVQFMKGNTRKGEHALAEFGVDAATDLLTIGTFGIGEGAKIGAEVGSHAVEKAGAELSAHAAEKTGSTTTRKVAAAGLFGASLYADIKTSDPPPQGTPTGWSDAEVGGVAITIVAVVLAGGLWWSWSRVRK